MFYQALPLHNSYPFLSLPTHPHNNLLLLQSLALALQKSVTNYTLTLQQQPTPPQPTETPAPLSPAPSRKKTCKQTSVGSQAASKQSEKQSEVESEKLASLVTIADTKSPTETHIQDSSSEINLKDEALLPNFGLSSQERQIKMSGLMERQVDGWKIERQRKKSSKISYSWY